MENYHKYITYITQTTYNSKIRPQKTYKKQRNL